MIQKLKYAKTEHYQPIKLVSEKHQLLENRPQMMDFCAWQFLDIRWTEWRVYLEMVNMWCPLNTVLKFVIKGGSCSWDHWTRRKVVWTAQTRALTHSTRIRIAERHNGPSPALKLLWKCAESKDGELKLLIEMVLNICIRITMPILHNWVQSLSQNTWVIGKNCMKN